MTTVQIIMQHLTSLPESVQHEILDFIEFLESRKKRAASIREDDEAWSSLSLESAMRGMEDEETAYTSADLKEAFS